MNIFGLHRTENLPRLLLFKEGGGFDPPLLGGRSGPPHRTSHSSWGLFLGGFIFQGFSFGGACIWGLYGWLRGLHLRFIFGQVFIFGSLCLKGFPFGLVCIWGGFVFRWFLCSVSCLRVLHLTGELLRGFGSYSYFGGFCI